MFASPSISPLSPPTPPLWGDDSFAYLSTSSSVSSSMSRSSPSFSTTTRSTSIRESIQVMVRCRPRSEKEQLESNGKSCWLIRSDQGLIELEVPKSSSSKNRLFYFDNVIIGDDNAQVYKSGIQDLVRSTMMGYNGTVFAYGQTASGKTYTMMGTKNQPGIIPRAIEEVFMYINEDSNEKEYLIRVSYLEIYNEQIKDLLDVNNKNVNIVSDKKRGAYVCNLKEVAVKSPEDIFECIKQGEVNRHTSATDYNDLSSRSHSMFQLIIETRSKGAPIHASEGVRISQLNLIDLAGSEKVTTNINRRREGAYINKSLLTLGNVISKLTSGIAPTHIPFRDSKLTRILQSSLSGNARIAVICTINPNISSRDESLNTLRFAQRAKLIKTSAKMTRIMNNSQLKEYLLQIEDLKKRMQEKNEVETETKERLNSLLELILTNSKVNNMNEQEDNEELSRATNLSIQTTADTEETIKDVVARCEEGYMALIASHQKQVTKMMIDFAATKDTLSVMKALSAQQEESLAKREAQIKSLNQELTNMKITVSKPSPSANPKHISIHEAISFLCENNSPNSCWWRPPSRTHLFLAKEEELVELVDLVVIEDIIDEKEVPISEKANRIEDSSSNFTKNDEEESPKTTKEEEIIKIDNYYKPYSGTMNQPSLIKFFLDNWIYVLLFLYSYINIQYYYQC